jgi:hypothetical protein
MGPPNKKTKRSEAAWIVDKEKNPLSEEENHFIRTCCQVTKIDEKEKIDSVGAKTVLEGNDKTAGMIAPLGSC